MNDWMPERLATMPDADDMRALARHLAHLAGLRTRAVARVLDHPFPLQKLPLARVPQVVWDAVQAAPPPRGPAYAYGLQGLVLPPALLAGGTRLLDGKHRCYAARACNRRWVLAIDLAEAIPGLLAVADLPGWPLIPDLLPARKPPGPPLPSARSA